MNHKKVGFLGIAGVLGMVLVGCGQEKEIDASKYTATPQKLESVFHKEYKGYQLTNVEATEENGKAVYEMKGYNAKDKKEAELSVEADKMNNIVEQKTEKEHHVETVLNLKDVKKNPKVAIQLAQKAANLKSTPSEWKLKMNKDNKPIYKIKFEKDQKEVTIDAKTGTKLAIEIDK